MGEEAQKKAHSNLQDAVQASTAEDQREPRAHVITTPHQMQGKHNTKAMPVIGSWRGGDSVTAAVLVLMYQWEKTTRKKHFGASEVLRRNMG